jgi:hypothetical protein
MGKVRGVRFTVKEDALIEEFLRINPMIDFSTLAKISILDFVKRPQINLRAVGKAAKKEARNVRPTT